MNATNQETGPEDLDVLDHGPTLLDSLVGDLGVRELDEDHCSSAGSESCWGETESIGDDEDVEWGALATLSPPETDPQILERWGCAQRLPWANVSKRRISVSNFGVTCNSFREFHTLDWLPHVCALPERHVLKYVLAQAGFSFVFFCILISRDSACRAEDGLLWKHPMGGSS